MPKFQSVPNVLVEGVSGAHPVVIVGANGAVVGSVATKTVAFDGEQGPSTAAVLSTNLAGANNDLDITAVTAGADGNDITVAYIDPGANNAALSVSVTGTAITVNLATGGGGAITSTAADVDAAIDALPAAAALVTPANKAANDGSGVVIAMAAAPLVGGMTPTATLFTVTGVVAVKVFARCTESLAGATATVEVGTALTTAGLIAQTTGTDLDINEIWHDATPDASVEAITVLSEKIVAQDIIQTIGTAGVTDGTLVYYCLWSPISSNGAVVAA
ncbi:MAG: hypothetical protein KBF28_03790 [Gemmatimonadales bacterium]|nr:hypothetical protein [Gemmatimonadales bacterium]